MVWCRPQEFLHFTEPHNFQQPLLKTRFRLMTCCALGYRIMTTASRIRYIYVMDDERSCPGELYTFHGVSVPPQLPTTARRHAPVLAPELHVCVCVSNLQCSAAWVAHQARAWNMEQFAGGIIYNGGHIGNSMY